MILTAFGTDIVSPKVPVNLLLLLLLILLLLID